MIPSRHYPKLVNTLSRTGKRCDEPSEVEIDTWVPSANHRKLLQVITTVRHRFIEGCASIDATEEATGRYVNLCCNGSSSSSSGSGSSCSVSGADSILYADTCPGGRTASGGGGGSWPDSFSGTFHQIVSLTPDLTTVTDGDLVTFTAIWKLRDDVEAETASMGSVCCSLATDDRAACALIMGTSGTGVVLQLISTVADRPECLRQGETYSYAATYLVHFIDSECMERTLSVAFQVGRPEWTKTPCSTTPARAFAVLNTTGTVDCLDDDPPPPGAAAECDESSSGSSSVDPSVPSGSEPSGPSGSGPSISEPA